MRIDKVHRQEERLSALVPFHTYGGEPFTCSGGNGAIGMEALPHGAIYIALRPVLESIVLQRILMTGDMPLSLVGGIVSSLGHHIAHGLDISIHIRLENQIGIIKHFGFRHMAACVHHRTRRSGHIGACVVLLKRGAQATQTLPGCIVALLRESRHIGFLIGCNKDNVVLFLGFRNCFCFFSTTCKRQTYWY